MPCKDKEQRNAYQRRYYRDKMRSDPDFKARHYQHRDATKHRAAAVIRVLVEEFRSAGCILCPEHTACCLTAHHLDPTTKRFNIGDCVGRAYAPATVIEELKKCVCLCWNCHAKVHAGLVVLLPERRAVVSSAAP